MKLNHNRNIGRLVAAVFLVSSSMPIIKAEDGLDGSSPAYSFMNVTSSTRIFGLGGINISTVDPDNVNTIDQNPALLGPEFGMQIGLNYMHWLDSSNFAGIRACNAIGEHSAWSAAIQYFGYGSIRQTEPDGTISGEYSPSDVSFSVGMSHDFTGLLRGGFAVKMAFSSYADYSAVALATDLGLNYYDPDTDLSLSFVAANLGGQIKRFNEAYDRLPIDIRLGFSKSFGEFPIRFSITAWNLTKWHLPYIDNGDGTESESTVIKDSFGSNLMRHLVFGADLITSDKFNVAVGYNYKTRTDMSTYSRNFLSGFSLSAGINVNAFGFGLAIAQPHAGATTLMVNFTTNIYDLTH